jgi:hypothetical protein
MEKAQDRGSNAEEKNSGRRWNAKPGLTGAVPPDHVPVDRALAPWQLETFVSSLLFDLTISQLAEFRVDDSGTVTRVKPAALAIWLASELGSC